jgi:hypothetical protein
VEKMSHSEELNYFDLLVAQLKRMNEVTVDRIDIHYHEIYLSFRQEKIKIKVDNLNREYNYPGENSPGLVSNIDEVLRRV